LHQKQEQPVATGGAVRYGAPPVSLTDRRRLRASTVLRAPFPAPAGTGITPYSFASRWSRQAPRRLRGFVFCSATGRGNSLWYTAGQNLAVAVLAIRVPAENEREPDHVEHVLDALHARMRRGDEVTLSLARNDGRSGLFVECPQRLRQIVAGGMQVFYPDAEVESLDAPLRDAEHAVAFNVFDCPSRKLEPLVASGIVEVFKKLNADLSWGPRLEDLLRNSAQLLLEQPGTTLISLERLLSDEKFRQRATREIRDPTIRNYWLNEVPAWSNSSTIANGMIAEDVSMRLSRSFPVRQHATL